MCGVSVANTIVEMLDELLKGLKTFTAYDVTLAARNVSSENIKHDEVRAILENEFTTNQMAGYDRQLCTLDLSNRPQAQVYFPDTESASSHALVSAATPSTILVQTAPPAYSAPVVLADGEVATTNAGRVQIPRKLLAKVTTSGGSYDVRIGSETKYSVADARGDVRVCLRQFGIKDDKVCVTVDTANNTINIETV